MKKTAENKHKIHIPPVEKAPTHTANIIPWVLYFLSPYLKQIIFFFTLRIVRQTIIALSPVVLGLVIDALEDGKAFNNPQFYGFMLIGYLILYTVMTCGNIIFYKELVYFEKASRALTLYSIRHLNKLSLNWHENQESGGVLQRVMTGRKSFQELMRHIRWDFFYTAGHLVAIIVSTFLIDIPLFFLPLYILFFTSYLAVSWISSKPFFNLYDKFNITFERLLGGIYEFISAIRTVKSFHLNDHIIHKAQALEQESQKSAMKVFGYDFIRWTVVNFVSGIWLIIFAGIGFYQVIHGNMTAGAFAAAFFLAYNMMGALEYIASIQEKLYNYSNGIHRLTTTLCIRPSLLDIAPLTSLSHDWSSIRLEQIGYIYNQKDGHGIQNVDLTIKRGEKVAFVGNSGAGKSTLVKLLMKQMNPDHGTIHINNHDLRHIPTSDWLSQIGFVPQDIELFNLSIRDNILIDQQDYAPKKLDHVLKQAALDDFIASLPEGLDTIVGERGIKLSGGQRQRLGIARALVREAPIMIFDEATSSLDSISESKIQTAMENSFTGHTVFLIAHRLSTVRHVDKIYVLDQGTIIEQGTFDKLINANGHFARLWNLQSKAA